MNTCYIASTYSTCTLEEISAAAPGGLRWFQLYIHRNRMVSQQLVQRAEALGFQGLVLTADLPYTGKRRDDVRNGFCLPPHMKLKNLEGAFEVCQMSLSFHSLGWRVPHETKTTASLLLWHLLYPGCIFSLSGSAASWFDLLPAWFLRDAVLHPHCNYSPLEIHVHSRADEHVC